MLIKTKCKQKLHQKYQYIIYYGKTHIIYCIYYIVYNVKTNISKSFSHQIPPFFFLFQPSRCTHHSYQGTTLVIHLGSKVGGKMIFHRWRYVSVPGWGNLHASKNWLHKPSSIISCFSLRMRFVGKRSTNTPGTWQPSPGTFVRAFSFAFDAKRSPLQRPIGVGEGSKFHRFTTLPLLT